MIRYGFRLGGRLVIVMSWRPSKDGAAQVVSLSKPAGFGHTPAVLSSIMILSAIWMISGEAPTEAPGMMPPSSVMADASMMATSSCEEWLARVRIARRRVMSVPCCWPCASCSTHTSGQPAVFILAFAIRRSSVEEANSQTCSDAYRRTGCCHC